MKGKFLITLAMAALAAVTAAGAGKQLVTRADAPEAPAGLDGAHIALWQSHGRYFDRRDSRWKWQRSRIFGTVEDLYTQTYVLPFLVPMLENAGANVLMPRERDTNRHELIVDNDGGLAAAGYRESHGKQKWHDAPGEGFAFITSTLAAGSNPFTAGTARTVKTTKDESHASRAVWNPEFPESGEYAVYVSYKSLPESADDALYRVNSLAGQKEFRVNQRMGGGTWIYLGTFPFAAGSQEEPAVELVGVSDTKGSVVTADAVKIGGGMGNVERGGRISGSPRWAEGARYWLQWAGMPESVYTPTGNENDYEDDFKSRGLWVNHLAGGSARLPDAEGAGIPIDLAFALHSDAGTTPDYETIGTLPIVSTAGKTLGDGSSRNRSVSLANMVSGEIIPAIRSHWDPDWTLRPLRDKSYHEAREPQVPALLLELLSHQNLADMRYGLDPEFRFEVSRAIYKGMLRFLAERDGRDYVVQPLPVSDFAITGSGGKYELSWAPTPDSTEPTAMPDYYIVYERAGSGGFTELAVVDDPYISVTVPDERIYSYRIVAANSGGVSFPSETLALCNRKGKREQVVIVNGFTRVSGPPEIPAGNSTGGFDYRSDHGVPYLRDTGYTGEQTEFRKWIEWTTDDSPGFGASRADMETKIIAGNTFDYPYIHGEAIAAAGHPFISTSLGGYLANSYSEKTVDLILGKQREIKTGRRPDTRFKAIPDTLQKRLEDLAARGGNLLVTGAYVATDLFDNPHSSGADRDRDKRFASRVLGMEWRTGKATASGEVKEVRSRFPEFSNATIEFNTTLGEDCYAVESPDSFSPVSLNSSAIMRYTENDYIAATAFDPGIHRAVTIGFPFETIRGADSRNRLMGQIMQFFTAGNHPAPKITVSQPAAKKQTPANKNKKDKKKKKKGKKK